MHGARWPARYRTTIWKSATCAKDGSSIWINLSVSLVRTDEGAPKYFISVIEDISRRKNAEGALLHLANYDVLTGLPNRALMQDRLAQSLAYAQRAATQVAVIALDLDHFNNINDSLGSAIGDQILTQIGQKLLANVRHGDTAARLGGDDFMLILNDLEGEESVELATQRTLQLIAEPITSPATRFTAPAALASACTQGMARIAPY